MVHCQIFRGLGGPRECHGFLKPVGFAAGFSGVRVRVGNSVPPKNPYPWHGFWVTRTVTRHMRDLPLGHQRQRLTVNNSCQQRRRWQQLDGNGEPPSPPSPLPPPPPSPMPPPPCHKRTTQRKTCDGEDDEGRGRAVVPTPNRYVFSSFQRGEEGYAPPRCVFGICCFDATRRGIYPSSSCHSSFGMAGRGMPPPHRVFVSFLTRRGGVYPSPLGNVTGYPGVFQGNPYPYPSKPVPAPTGMGFTGTGRGFSQTRGQINILVYIYTNLY